MFKFVECPRDAMQGYKSYISTEDKIRYIQSIIETGFDIIDFGSFVSPKIIPQLSDTSEVIKNLNLKNSSSKLLAIVLNERGANEASLYKDITYLGIPFSISETFQNRNGNSTIQANFERIKNIQKICIENEKILTVYISMGFGNPYGDFYSKNIVIEWIDKLKDLGIEIFSISDTIGIATPESINDLFRIIKEKFNSLEIGAHLHSSNINWLPKIQAAVDAGCERYDIAIGGYGGCPMANDSLVGNIASENFYKYYKDKFKPSFNFDKFEQSISIANEIFI